MLKLLPFCAALLMAPADTIRAGAADPTLEIVTFRLIPAANTADFVTAAQGTEAWLKRTQAVVARSLSVDDTGLWTDAVTWRSKADALKAAEEAMNRPEFAPFMALIDADTVDMRHAQILWQME
ncbi:MAG: hypothetical protein AAGO57_03160 [Pseudomonadota bacterium]